MSLTVDESLLVKGWQVNVSGLDWYGYGIKPKMVLEKIIEEFKKENQVRIDRSDVHIFMYRRISHSPKSI